MLRPAFLAVVAAAAALTQSIAAEPHVPVSVHEALERVIPGIKPDSVSATPVPGLYEVVLSTRVVYISADGNYLVRGDLIDLQTRENLSEKKRKGVRLAELGQLSQDSMIVFTADNVKHTVTVFTDVDCGYCARLHKQMADYNRLGITIRYVAFPRAGIPSGSYDKTVSVWCSDDPHTAIGDAKFGKPVEARTCDNPVKNHYVTGQLIGVSGTPTIVLDDGEVLPGYVPPEQLLQFLDRA